jgi:hypothetical protein
MEAALLIAAVSIGTVTIVDQAGGTTGQQGLAHQQHEG